MHTASSPDVGLACAAWPSTSPPCCRPGSCTCAPAGAEPATARARQLALRRFSAWLLEEGGSDADHLLGVEALKRDAEVAEPLTPEQINALVAARAGRDLRDRRDEALGG